MVIITSTFGTGGNKMRWFAFLYRAILVTFKNFKSFCILNGSFVHRIMLIYFINIYNEFIVMDIAGRTENGYIRVGGSGDGSYVMYNDFRQGKIAYSFGIGDNVAWDLDMAGKGFDIYMYDYSVTAPPVENGHFHFFQERLGNKGKSLEEIIDENGHTKKKDLILKMDIEAAEWGLLKKTNIETLHKFQQIVAEIHFPFNLFCVYAEPLLKKINQTHQIVHIHANNVNDYDVLAGIKFPMYLEVTWLRRDDYHFQKNVREFPTKLDHANIEEKDDIYLGRWNESLNIKDKLPFNS